MRKHHKSDRTSNNAEERDKIICFPYIKGLSENLERLCHQLDIKFVFKSNRTLRSLLTKVKTKTRKEKIKGVVYRIGCSCGKTYIGETGRNLDIRLKEHKRAVKMDNQNNGIAVHVNKTLHDIEWNNAEILEQESNWTKRKVKEALHIKEHTTMNLDQGVQINTIWSTLNIN